MLGRVFVGQSKYLIRETNFVLCYKIIFIFSGVIVAGGFGSRGIEGKINAIEWARTNHKPFLGICLGLECAVIEFSRNVLGLKNANSSEFAKVENQVVSIY